jgi:hypothetical protein
VCAAAHLLVRLALIQKLLQLRLVRLHDGDLVLQLLDLLHLVLLCLRLLLRLLQRVMRLLVVLLQERVEPDRILRGGGGGALASGAAAQLRAQTRARSASVRRQ